MLRYLIVAVAAFLWLAPTVYAQGADNAAANVAAQPDFSWVDKLQRQSGVVRLAGTGAELDLGQSYDFLGAEDAKRVIVEIWGNPPDAANDVLGLVLPKGGDPRLADVWGAVVTFMDIGYVADKDAAKTDYNKLLADMRQGEDEDNAARQKNHFDTVHLVGWAEPPSYDAQKHLLIWARDLQIGGGDRHSLNYDIRVLGRRGVLSLNVVAPLSQLPSVHEAASSIGATARYGPGDRYADYDRSHDKTAAFGIAGLIAAGAGALAVKKLGLLGLVLAFGKKAFILIAAGFAGAAAWFRRVFGGLFGRGKRGGSPPAGPPTGGDIVS